MKKVLLVDDEKPYLFALSDILHNDGYKVIQLDSAENIDDIIKSSQPDCIVIDATLKDTSGFEISRQLKKNSDFSDIPLILLIPVNGEYKLYDAVTSRANDCIEKPVKRQELLEKVERQISIRERETKTKALNDMVYKVLDKTSFGLLILNFDFEVIYYNKEISGYLGSDASLIGRKIWDVFKNEAELLKDMLNNKKHIAKSGLFLFTLNEFPSGYSIFIESNNAGGDGECALLSETLTDIVLSESASFLCKNFSKYLMSEFNTSHFFICSLIHDKCLYIKPDTGESFLDVLRLESFLAKTCQQKELSLGNLSVFDCEDASFFKDKGFLSYIALPSKNSDDALLILDKKESAFLNYTESLPVVSNIFMSRYKRVAKTLQHGNNIYGSVVEVFKKVLSLSDKAHAVVSEGELLYSDAGHLSSFNAKLLEFFKEELNEKDYHWLISSMKASDGKSRLKLPLKRGFDLVANIFNIEDTLNVCIFEADKEGIVQSFENIIKKIYAANPDKAFKEIFYFFTNSFGASDTFIFTYNTTNGSFELRDSSASNLSIKSGFCFADNLPKVSSAKIVNISKESTSPVIEAFYTAGLKTCIAIDIYHNSNTAFRLFIASKNKNSFFTFHLDVLGRIMQELSNLILRIVKEEADLALETGNNMLLALTRDAIFKLDDKGIIISVNNAIQFLLGYTPEELLGTHIDEICSAENKWETLITKPGRYAFKNKKGGKKPFDTNFKKLDNAGYYLVFHRI